MLYWSNPVRVSSRAQVIASLDQTRVKLGDPIKLHFRLKNVSSEAVNVVWGGFNENYWLMVIDASGRELPLTKEGERLRQPSKVEIHSISGALGPGTDDGDHAIGVAKHYQLDRPGSYFVRIARRIGVPPDIPPPGPYRRARACRSKRPSPTGFPSRSLRDSGPPMPRVRWKARLPSSLSAETGTRRVHEWYS